MRARLFSGQEKTLTFAAIALIVAVGVGGAGLATATRLPQSVSAQVKARQQVASWLLPVEEFRTDNGSYAGMNLRLIARYELNADWTGARLVMVSRERYCIERDVRPVVSRAGSLAPIVSGPCTRAATMAAPLAHDDVPPDLPATADLLPVWGAGWYRRELTQLPMQDIIAAFPTRVARFFIFGVIGESCVASRPGSLTSTSDVPCTLPADDEIHTVGGPAWFLAELTRYPMQSYWLEHGGSYQGASTAKLRKTYGSSSWLNLHADIKIVTATRQGYCATISYRAVTVSLHGPDGPVTIAGCT